MQDHGYAATSGLFNQAIRDAREAFTGPPAPWIFDERSRLDVVKASRDLSETVAAFDADLDPFIERIKRIDAPASNVIDMQAAKTALLAAQVGLRVVPREPVPASCGGKGPAVSGCSCSFCRRSGLLVVEGGRA